MKIKDIIIESKTVKVEPTKPRNFVAKNAMKTTSGAGAHRDKKKEQKQGYEKHKGQSVAEYGDTAKGQKMLTKVHKRAVDRMIKADDKRDAKGAKKNQQSANRAWDRFGEKEKYGESIEEISLNEMRYDREFEVDGWTYMTYLDYEDDNRKYFHMAKDPEGKEYDIHFTPYGRLDPKTFKLWIKLGAPKNLSKFGSFNRDDVIKAAQAQGIAKLDPELAKAEGMSERVRDPEDWDEGNTEPANNFAVYINGKKWKVFKGRGYYADDQREQDHFRQLKAWAAKKSIDTGKKWEVYITGESPTE